MRFLRILAWLAAIGVAVLTVGAALAPHTAVAALLNNLLLQMAVGTAGLLLLTMLLRRWRPALVMGVMLAVQAGLLAPGADLGLDGSAQAAAGEPIRIVAYNLLFNNRDHARSLEFLRQEAADVVVLEEVTPEWGAALEALADVYPYRVDGSRSGYTGMALLSRLPLVRSSAGWTDGDPAPVVDAVVDFGDRQLRVVGTHVTHGFYRGGFAHQARQLDSLVDYMGTTDMPTVLAGDFNMASWAPRLQDLAERTGLAVTPGLVGTWHASLPAPARVPIDHVLASPDLRVTGRTVGPDLGSDHRPVLVTLQPADG